MFLVGYKEIADNYQKAIDEGEADDWIETDNAYYEVSLLCAIVYKNLLKKIRILSLIDIV